MIYDEAHLINAKALDGAIPGAAARYENKSPSALPTIADLRQQHILR